MLVPNVRNPVQSRRIDKGSIIKVRWNCFPQGPVEGLKLSHLLGFVCQADPLPVVSSGATAGFWVVLTQPPGGL